MPDCPYAVITIFVVPGVNTNGPAIQLLVPRACPLLPGDMVHATLAMPDASDAVPATITVVADEA